MDAFLNIRLFFIFMTAEIYMYLIFSMFLLVTLHTYFNVYRYRLLSLGARMWLLTMMLQFQFSALP